MDAFWGEGVIRFAFFVETFSELIGAAFLLSACSSDDIGQFPTQSEQPAENDDDKKDDSSDENSNDGDGNSGVWTPPVKQ